MNNNNSNIIPTGVIPTEVIPTEVIPTEYQIYSQKIDTLHENQTMPTIYLGFVFMAGLAIGGILTRYLTRK